MSDDNISILTCWCVDFLFVSGPRIRGNEGNQMVPVAKTFSRNRNSPSPRSDSRVALGCIFSSVSPKTLKDVNDRMCLQSARMKPVIMINARKIMKSRHAIANFRD